MVLELIKIGCARQIVSPRRVIMDQIITELSKHSNIEEQILYPVLR
jgi:hypothetical protein